MDHFTEYVQRFATKEAADAATDGKDDEDEDEEMSEFGSISDDDAGHMDL
jgi:ubiquitin-conjugating enzyme E2 H